MRNKKLWFIIGAVVVIAAIIIGIRLTQEPTQQQRQVYKIGAILPLTGPLAQIQEVLKNGMELAAKEINNAGGIDGRKLVIVYQDNQGDPKQSVSAFQQLLVREKLPVIISDHSPLSAPLRPLAEQNGVLLFATIVSLPEFTKGYKYVARDFVSSDLESKLMAEFLVKERGIKRAGVLYVADDYGRGAYEVFRETLERLGGFIVTAEQFSQTETNFRTILTKMYTSNPEAIYLVGRERSFASALVQMKETGFPGVICTTISLNARTVIEQAGNALEGVYFTNINYFPDNPSNEKMRLFVEKFKKEYGDPNNYICVYGYDIIHYLADAIREGGYTADGIKKALIGRRLKTVRGEVVVPENLDIQTPLVVAQVQGGKFKVVYTQQGRGLNE
jgi:branched-chain amino acid transport system substrate-binding protein